MSNGEPEDLEEAIRRSGEGWLIDWFKPPQNAMDYIRHTLEQVNQVARSRPGDGAPTLTESSLLAEFRRNPGRVRGFFQMLGVSRTPVILLMAWRIIQGMEIKKVEIKYTRKLSFELQVVLESPYGVEDQPYCSSDINDFRIFRHIGIMEIGTAPVFDGFYPLRLPR